MIFIPILEKIYHLIYVQFSLSVFYLEKIFNLRLFFKNVLIHEITKREIARIRACFFRFSSLFVWIKNIRSSRTVVCFLFFLFFFSKKLFDQSKKRTISLSPDNLVRVYYKHVSFCADISQAYQRKAHNYSPWRWRHSTLNVNLKYGCQQSKKTVCNSHE